MSSDGPVDPNLWITRKIGLREAQSFGKLDHTSNNNIVMNTCISADYLDPVKMEQAYRSLIYNQPNFRADVKRGENGEIYFIPATDYSDVFQFYDQSEVVEDMMTGYTGYTGCWELAEKLANQPFTFGSGKPLHKCYLVKRPDCYILLNQYHHGISDGTSGFRVINEILRQYDLISSGKGADLTPAPVLPSVGDMAQFAQDDGVVERMIENRVRRAKLQQTLLPVNQDEAAASRGSIPWVNKTLSAIGTSEGFRALKALCKESKITIGSYSFAVLFFAVAAVHIRRKGGKFPEKGLPTQYADLPADIRSRLQPDPGNCFMVCVSETWIEATIEEDSSLLDIAEDIGQQLQACYAEQRLPLYQGAYQDRLRESQHYEFLNSAPTCEVYPSNKMVYNYPTKYSWGEMTSTHSLGSYYCPGSCNHCAFYHCVDGVMDYSVVCCDGKENIRNAQDILDLFVEFMEHTEKVTGNTTVMDFVDSRM